MAGYVKSFFDFKWHEIKWLAMEKFFFLLFFCYLFAKSCFEKTFLNFFLQKKIFSHILYEQKFFDVQNNMKKLI